MLTIRQIPALFNGVSQQPSAVRDPSQWEYQKNISSSVVDGTRPRSPVEHIAKVSDDDLSAAYLHSINRDAVERYVVVIEETGIKVFDLEGNEKTVTAPLGYGYLDLPTGAEARFSYRAVTVADYTFIVNKTKTVAMGAVGADLDPPDDDYWWLNRVISDSPSALVGAGRFIYEEPYRPPFQGGGSTTPPVNTNTDITPNQAGSYKGEVQTLQDLDDVTPAEGDVYKIVGTNESAFQSYYVIRKGSTWNETVKPGLKNLIDASTMPHALIRQGDGTFLFGPFAWSPRRVGDEASNRNPTFVGRPIRDVFFFKNRLGFCVDENVILSRAGDFGNFYRLTVVDYLPDEVVDVAASETTVAKMEFAVPFQDTMMLFSDQTQFKLEYDTALTGATVSLTPVTKYPMVPAVPPVQSGADVYFASKGSGYGQLREYFIDPDNETHDAADVSAHVPRYIPGTIHSIVASPEFNFVGVATDDEPANVYVYQYYWDTETRKVQSAWNFWDLSAGDAGAAILGMTIVGGYLYLLTSRRNSDATESVHLERVSLFHGSGIANLQYQVYLDRRTALTGTYSAETNRTTFTIPYSIISGLVTETCVLLGSDFGEDKGSQVRGSSLVWNSDTEFSAPGDLTAGEVAFGFPYESRMTFSAQYPVNRDGQAIHTGRLQLKTGSVYYTDTAYFRIEVRPNGPDTEPLYTHEVPSRRLTVDGMATLGDAIFTEGSAQFAVQANSKVAEVSIVNDTPLGFCIYSAEWEGFYHNRARA